MAGADVWNSGFRTGCCLSGRASRNCRVDPGSDEAWRCDIDRASKLSGPAYCRDPARPAHRCGESGPARDDARDARADLPSAPAGLVYLNPTLQNPTAITIPERRRKELANIAKRCNVRIVEDDPYWLLADAPPPPIAAVVPEQVCYISTLSKCLTPGLRVAFVLIRDQHERERFLVALRSFSLMVAPLTAALATQWILDGSAAALMEGVRKEARLRHWMARDILAGRYSGTGDGLHIWLELPGYWSSSQLARAADSEGIAVTPVEAFATGSDCVNAIRISLGSIKDRGRLQTGLQRLSHLLARRPEPFSAAVV